MSLKELEGLRTRSRLAVKWFDETCGLEALRGTVNHLVMHGGNRGVARAMANKESCEGGKWEGARWGKEEERSEPFDRSCDGCVAICQRNDLRVEF
ncbi:hypothetical protein B0H12DRAFT_1112747 [Mycena haematopus]|nr:hypothetical protein B0H12DRAFT_1112747 [Mycena haematopus]